MTSTSTETQNPSPISPPVALAIAGSDSSGGAGIQADCKTMEACGVFATTALTSVNAGNTRGVKRTHLIPVSEIEAQIDAVLDDFDVQAVKTGMLATTDIIETVTGYAKELPNLVVDPVMVTAAGDRLLDTAAGEAYEDLIATARVVTPNAEEAAVLTGIEPTTERDLRAAGQAIVEMGAEAALIKDGHLSGEEVVDVLVTADGVEQFRYPRIETDITHGAGCTLSSALTAYLAQQQELSEAVEASLDLVARAIQQPFDIGEGPGSVQHLVKVREQER
jgi:hydroxymethylpyrimidine/phosphomethylpyrimidine kinase